MRYASDPCKTYKNSLECTNREHAGHFWHLRKAVKNEFTKKSKKLAGKNIRFIEQPPDEALIDGGTICYGQVFYDRQEILYQ